MPVPIRYTLAHGPALAALGRVVLSSLQKPERKALPATPTPWIETVLPPRQPEIVRDYIRHAGGDPGWYKNRVPAHYFHEWGFAVGARALEGLGLPLVKGVNGGCRLENRKPLPLGEPLIVRARIESIDADDKRAIVTERVVTGTAKVPEAIVADMRVFFPLSSGKEKSNGGGPKAPKARPTVPNDAKELSFQKIGADAGLEFAKLTGDFNPIHWIPPYARASGFRTVILHGFSTLARAVEALNRSRFAGDPMKLKSIDVRMTRPLVLPARVGIYVTNDGGIWVGDAPGGGAYLEGRFETTEARS